MSVGAGGRGGETEQRDCSVLSCCDNNTHTDSEAAGGAATQTKATNVGRILASLGGGGESQEDEQGEGDLHPWWLEGLVC